MIAPVEITGQHDNADEYLPEGLPYRLPSYGAGPNPLYDYARRHGAYLRRLGDQANLLVHKDVNVLARDFLELMQRLGHPSEQRLYAAMTPSILLLRLLAKRPLTFWLPQDCYVLRTGQRGEGGFEFVGTDQEQPPLILEDVLSYDEMALSALIAVSTPTPFFNDGRRNNRGMLARDAASTGTFPHEGVYTGAVGARFEREGVMEHAHMVLTPRQNTRESGYGSEGSGRKAELLRMWARFYGRDRNLPEWREVSADDASCYVSLPGCLFDADIYKRRIRMSIEPFLLDADERAKRRGEELGRPAVRAYAHVVGLGVGAWALEQTLQTDLMLQVYQQVLEVHELQHIGTIDFSWFGDACDKSLVGHSRVRILFSRRNPGEPVGTDDLLVAMYAWDGNAFPGNEFWDGHLDNSGDPAAACCSAIPLLQNPDVNPRLQSPDSIRVLPSPALQTDVVGEDTLDSKCDPLCEQPSPSLDGGVSGEHSLGRLSSDVNLATQLTAVMGGFAQRCIDQPFKALVIGEAGSGKTRLLDWLECLETAVRSPLSDRDLEALHARASGAVTAGIRTDRVSIEGVSMCLSEVTPGWSEVLGVISEDEAYLRCLEAVLLEVKYLNCVLVVVDGSQRRPLQLVGHALRAIAARAPKELLDKFVIVYTHVDSVQHRKFPAEQLRHEMDCIGAKTLCHDLEGGFAFAEVHLQNPLGRLASLGGENLRRQLHLEGSSLRLEVESGARSAVDLLKRLREFPSSPLALESVFSTKSAVRVAAGTVLCAGAAALVGPEAALGAGVVCAAGAMPVTRRVAAEAVEGIKERRQANARAVAVAKDEAAETALQDAIADESAVRALASARAEVARELGRFPILVSRAPGRVDLPDVEMKLKVKGDMLVGQLLYIIRKKVSPKDGQADQQNQTYYMMSDDKALMTSWNVYEVYHKFASEDGFLRLSYTAENTLGGVCTLECRQ